MIREFMKKRKLEKQESELQKYVGKTALDTIKNVLKEDIMLWFGLSCEKDFDDFMADYWSFEWVNFLDKNGLELCYNAEPIYKGEVLVDISIDIFEP